MKLASGGSLEGARRHVVPPSRGRSTTRAATSASLLHQAPRCSSSRATLFAVVRATELRRWTDSGAYTTILWGDYPRRADDDTASVSDAAQEAAASYTIAFERTQDTLGRLVHDLAGWMGTASAWINDRLRRGNESA